MEVSIVDFLTGLALMNAMPHLLFGLFGIRFFSLFGFSAKGNLAYALLNVFFALGLFHYEHGIQVLAQHGLMLGGLAMLLIYLLTGKFFYRLFNRDKAS